MRTIMGPMTAAIVVLSVTALAQQTKEAAIGKAEAILKHLQEGKRPLSGAVLPAPK